jgi:energy-converting hydrogenase Eha subunit A
LKRWGEALKALILGDPTKALGGITRWRTFWLLVLIGLSGPLFSLLSDLGKILWKEFFVFLLNLATVWLQSARNDVYIEISKGHHEGLSLELFGMVAALVCAIVFSLVIQICASAESRRLGDSRGPSIAQQHPRLASGVVVLAIFIGLKLFGSIVTVTYTNAAVTYFNQSFAICRPSMEEKEAFRILSDFARVESSQDYQEVINRLSRKAEDMGAELSDFQVWR